MIQIIGHRGASALRPENTISAFDKAFFDGASGIEFDVRRCKGHEELVVVIHDSTVDRTSNGQGRVKRLNIEQLRALDFGEGEKIPTLKEVLEKMSSRGQFFIEIKTRQIAHEVAAVVSEYVLMGKGKYEDCVVICFQPDVLERVREVNSDIHIGVHLEEVTIEESLEKDVIPLSLANLEADMQAAYDRLMPQYFLPSIEVVSKNLVDVAHQLGAKVATWTVNDKAEVKKAFEAKVDAVIGDNPSYIKKVLQSLK